MRQIFGNLDNIEGAGCCMEDFIHLLERTIRSLREKEVYTWHHGGVDDSEDDVGFVADIGKCWWGDHDDHEVEGPIRGGRDSVCWGTDGKWRYLGWVKPRHSQPAYSEETVEYEEEDGLNGVSCILLKVQAIFTYSE